MHFNRLNPLETMCRDVDIDPLEYMGLDLDRYAGKGEPASLRAKFMVVVHKLLASKNPAALKTMLFEKPVTIPYTHTLYGKTLSNPMTGYYKKTIYDRPIVSERSYNALRQSWVEARKIETAKGAEYEVHEMTKETPGLKTSEELTDKTMIVRGKIAFFNKRQALAVLAGFEQDLAGGGNEIARDGSQRLHYFGRYIQETLAEKAEKKKPATALRPA